MTISYDKLWKLLIDKKMKKTDLVMQAKISSNVLAKMGRAEPVSLSNIEKICLTLHCTVDEVVEIIPNHVETNLIKG